MLSDALCRSFYPLVIGLASLALTAASIGVHAAPSYSLTDLGPLLNQTAPPLGDSTSGGNPGTGTNSVGIAINKNGDAAGIADSLVSEEYDSSGTTTMAVEDTYLGFIYNGNGPNKPLLPIEMQSGAPLPTYPYSYTCTIGGLNASLQAAGSCLEQQTDGNLRQHALLWSGSTTTDLGSLFDAAIATETTGSQADDTSDALAIADSGEVVGYGTLTSSGEKHAFTYYKGTLTDINAAIYGGEQYNLFSEPTYANSISALAGGINKNGLIIGDHYFYGVSGSPDSAYNGYFPFLYDPTTGTTTPLLSEYGYAPSIEVTGNEQNGYEMGASINDSGEAAFTGIAPSGSQRTGVLYDSGTFTDIGAESDSYGNSYAPYYTSTHAIGDSGDVVGNALIPALNAQHHFVTTGGDSYTAIVWHKGKIYNLNDVTTMPPGYNILDAMAIDANGDIVATAEIDSGYRAVLLKTGSAYTVTDLGASNTAVAINAMGQVVGSAGLWTPTAANGTSSTAGFVTLGLDPAAINDSGEVAGTVADLYAASWSPTTPNGPTGTVTTYTTIGKAKTPTSDPPLINDALYGLSKAAFATGINASGKVCGVSTTKNSFNTQVQIEHTSEGTVTDSLFMDDMYGFVTTATGATLVGDADADGILWEWDDNTYYNLGSPLLETGVTFPTYALLPGYDGVNDNNEKVGWRDLPFLETTDGTVTMDVYDSSALFTNGSGTTLIPTLDAALTGYYSPSSNPRDFAFAVNDSGLIVGQSEANDGYGYVQHAFLWGSADDYVDLGALPGVSGGTVVPSGEVYSTAFAINSNGAAVGWSGIGDFGAGAHAVLWNGNAITDLNYEIPQTAGWTLVQANGINKKGQIVGEGILGGVAHGFLLTPK